METRNTFLSPLEELSIKSQYQFYKELDMIDEDIIHHLDNLNSIKGLSTLYSCQGHIEKTSRSYLVLKCTEELCYPLTEVLLTLEDELDLDIEWNQDVSYEIAGLEQRIEVIIVRGGMDYEYFKFIYEMLSD